MHNFPITRRHSNAARTKPETGFDFSKGGVTRQEFGQEADINYILSRFGVNSFARPVQYGEVDYDIDLQTALSAIEQAELGYNRLPEELRKQYPSWESVILALAEGTNIREIRELLRREEQPKQEPDDHATRPNAESSSEGNRTEPATSEGRGTIPDTNAKRA